jgi:hypothetical protein
MIENDFPADDDSQSASRNNAILDTFPQSIKSIDIDSAVCDGYGCFSRAKSQLIVKVGPKKTISRYLCESCKTKFNDRGKTDLIIQQQKSEVVSLD